MDSTLFDKSVGVRAFSNLVVLKCKILASITEELQEKKYKKASPSSFLSVSIQDIIIPVRINYLT